jgi:hypothetical protein
MGGALRVVGTSHLEVSHCILRRNLAERGGAVAVHYGAAPLLINNLFHDNHALLRASGLYASYSYPRLVHCTFTANTTAAPGAFYHTGCVDHVHAKPLHIGGIYWGNDTSYYDDLQIREAKPFYTAFCDVGLLAGGTGCVDLDPRFDLFGPAPFALQADSPLIDAAQAAAAAPWLPDLDLAGGPRIAGQAPDMGAYELATTTAAPPEPVPDLVLRCAPNPFNPRTVISWNQPQSGSVTLDIHDAKGHRLRTLVAGQLAAGHQEFAWDGRDAAGRSLPAGLYLVRLRGTAGTAQVKILLIM